MTRATSGQSSADTMELACLHRPLHDVAPGADGAWLATGEDPQFLLTLPHALEPGLYSVVTHLVADEGAQPRVYFDFGEGWSQDTSVALRAESAGARWSRLLRLPATAAQLRFDPIDHAGTFRFEGVVVTPVVAAEILPLLLADAAAKRPQAAAWLLEQAQAIVAAKGHDACCDWLLAAENFSDATPLPRYGAWCERFDTLVEGDAARLHMGVEGLPRRPLVSLLLATDGADAADLHGCIGALAAQAYPDWELCVVLDAAAPAAVRTLLRDHAARHSRIRLLPVPEVAGGIARQWTAAMALATGAYVGFLEARCELRPHALLALVAAAVRHDARVAYGDDDCVTSTGLREDGYFKPRWNAELLMAQDYLAPFALFDARLLRELGGLDVDADAPRHDLSQRLAGHIAPADAVHVPLVLAHWHGAATAAADWQMPRATIGTNGIGGAAPPRPRVSLLVPTRDRLPLLQRCVESILSRSTYPDYEILVVDNQSREPETLAYFAHLADEPRVRVLRYDAPFNYSAINNFAARHADGDVIGLVNNDVEVITPDWIEQMLRHVLHPQVAAVGAMLYYPDDTIQHAGVVVGLGGVAGHPYLRRPRGWAGQRGRATMAQAMTAVTGACLLVRREVFEALGGLDERLAVAFNDIDFCLRAHARGYRNVWTPRAELYHHESASRGSEDTPEKQARFAAEVAAMQAMWGPLLGDDPAYHPNLSLVHDDAFEPACRPRYPLSRWLRDVAPIRHPADVHPDPRPVS